MRFWWDRCAFGVRRSRMCGLRELLRELLTRMLSLSAGQLAQTNDSANHTVRKSTQTSPDRQKTVGPVLSATTEIAKKSCSCYRRGSQALEFWQKISPSAGAERRKHPALCSTLSKQQNPPSNECGHRILAHISCLPFGI